jgi:hypothetical protein
MEILPLIYSSKWQPLTLHPSKSPPQALSTLISMSRTSLTQVVFGQFFIFIFIFIFWREGKIDALKLTTSRCNYGPQNSKVKVLTIFMDYKQLTNSRVILYLEENVCWEFCYLHSKALRSERWPLISLGDLHSMFCFRF